MLPVSFRPSHLAPAVPLQPNQSRADWSGNSLQRQLEKTKASMSNTALESVQLACDGCCSRCISLGHLQQWWPGGCKK